MLPDKIRVPKRTIKIFFFVLVAFAIVIILVSIFFRTSKKNEIKGIKAVKEELSQYFRVELIRNPNLFSIEDDGNNYLVKVFINKKAYQLELDKSNPNSYDTARYFIREAAFVECIREKGVKIFIGDNEASRQQIPLLGRFVSMGKFIYDSEDILVKCNEVKEYCDNSGIMETPSVLFKGVAYPGVKSAKWFDSLVSCNVY